MHAKLYIANEPTECHIQPAGFVLRHTHIWAGFDGTGYF
ncbi:hypothetical protein SAMN05192544_1008125 [Paraburkholderia hospita]|nr:hypothetical protein SAMN05192544_1008125 [Paraburkholderia hospita]